MPKSSIHQIPLSEEDKAEAYAILTDYALRFDAPRYEQDHQLEGKLQEAFQIMRDGKRVPLDHLEQMCLYYGLHRYLSKWGGEMLSLSATEHCLYRELFLSVAAVEIPQYYRSDHDLSDLRQNGWYNAWERRRRHTIVDDVAHVRRVHESLLI